MGWVYEIEANNWYYTSTCQNDWYYEIEAQNDWYYEAETGNPLWILTHGIWNDGGIWIDTELWRTI